MIWKNKKYIEWRTKFAWLPFWITEEHKVVWLSWYERKWVGDSYKARTTKWSRTAGPSAFSPEWHMRLALVPTKLEGGYTVWLGRYAMRYVGPKAAAYRWTEEASRHHKFEKLRYIDYVERIMTNGVSDSVSSS